MKIIFLIGFMGAGKSTIGKKLASKLHVDFIDSDKAISLKTKNSIEDIFKFKGEDFFRELELDFFNEIEKMENIIVSTGGGFPCHHDLINKMNEIGTTIYLKGDANMLFSRLNSEKSKIKRPLLSNLNDNELLSFIEKKLSEREKYYAKATITIDALNLSIETLIQSILHLEKN